MRPNQSFALFSFGFAVLTGCAHSFAPAGSLTTAAPAKGWTKAYDEMIVSEVQSYPALLELSSERMDLCRNWNELDAGDRSRVLADLFASIAKVESDHDPRAMYNEVAIVDAQGMRRLDAVTGFPIVSEGLLQLSYDDQVSNGGRCRFNFSADREAFIADLAAASGKQSFLSLHPGRSILDPATNLACGVSILDHNLRHGTETLSTAAGHYWSTMRAKSHASSELRRYLRDRGGPCQTVIEAPGSSS